ncbi:unnamed protein product [Urochloa decumbens]|uniref:Gnk2-homologous domain-containing protein n=1 Tax=Urochloa decumbens TaxID=240449 RepID=A0ABC8WC12_9POAL
MMSIAYGVLLLLVLAGGLTPSPATGDVFCDNLKQVSKTLPKNTSSNSEHFATSTFGQAPDVVYALALCRGDIVDDSACGECVAKTFEKILNVTPPPQQQCYRAANLYDGPCVVVYSVDDILGTSNTTGGSGGGDTPHTIWNVGSWGSWGNWSIGNITGDAGHDDVAVAVNLLQALLVRTVQKAASPAVPGRFATGFTVSPVVFYSLAQCTPDLSAGDCLACLNRLLGMVNSTIALRNGGQIYATRCYLRYEAYEFFYNSTPMLLVRLPSAATPAPAPTTTVTPPSVPTATVKHKSRKFPWLL